MTLAHLLQMLFSTPLSPSQVSLLIASSAFLSVLLAAVGISATLSHRTAHQKVRRRAEDTWSTDQSAEATHSATSIKRGFIQLVTALGKSSTAQNPEELSRVRTTLVHAGYRSPDAPTILFGIKLFVAIVLPSVYGALRPPALQNLPYLQTVLLFVLCAVLGFYVPNIWVKGQARRRKRLIVEGFPDALDLMVVCVEAGLGLEATIHRVGEEMKLSNKVLNDELGLFDLEIRAGQSRVNALRNLARRTDLEDVRSFVALLVQTDRFGTSIAQALRVHADAMRTRRHQRAEEIANKIPVKLLFPLIFFLLPSLFVVIVGPGIIQIIRILVPIMNNQ